MSRKATRLCLLAFSRLCAFIYLAILVGTEGRVSQGQQPIATVNLGFGMDGQTHSFKIATLRLDDAGDADHLHLVATLNTGDAAAANMYIDATFANRNGFHYLYTQRGAASSPGVRMVAYQSSQGAPVDIYIVLINYWNQATYTVLEALQEAIYQNPSDTMGSLPPDSTIVFDSNNPAYRPVTYSDFSSQFGIGTAAPQKMLSVAGDMNIDQNDSNNGWAIDFTLGYGSGEGIGSARLPGSPNPYGLDFFTGFVKRLSITQGGAVGIGTSAPSATLEVNGSMKMTPGSNGVLTFADGSVQGSAFNPLQGINAGTSISAGRITVGSSAPDQQGNASQGIVFVDTVNGIQQQFPHAAIYTNGSSGWNGDLVFATDGDNSPATALNERMRILFNGNVGIGTSTPSEKLELNGNLKLAANSGSHVVFADGSQQSIAWTGTLTGGDYAESVDVTGTRDSFEPGDLLVIDPAHHGSFLKSSKPYSSLIGGVYATKPGVIGRRQAKDRPQDGEVPMAMIGIVPTKVCTENGPVHDGDLLVSSSTPGYAMKGTDRYRLTGAILGKALGSLESGTGFIEVLITLQ